MLRHIHCYWCGREYRQAKKHQFEVNDDDNEMILKCSNCEAEVIFQFNFYEDHTRLEASYAMNGPSIKEVMANDKYN